MDNIIINGSNQSALIQAYEGITGIKVLKKGEGAMSGKKKGMHTIWDTESPYSRKEFWSRERMAVRESIRSELQSELFGSANDTFHSAMSKETANNSLQVQ